ncbi:TMhelix containing protein [Vibrio phage 1.264.O._10N.286.51.F2]|nr:TMhelix containing protein [Vibrio phage 1.264.O._10N.286.51.F2]
MRVNLNSVMGVLLLIKNLLIILLLMVISPLDTETLESTTRLFFIITVGAFTVLVSDLEMRLLNWVVNTVKSQRKGQ